MSDIVERLRDNLNFQFDAQTLMHEAADEIERLRSDKDALLKALQLANERPVIFKVEAAS